MKPYHLTPKRDAKRALKGNSIAGRKRKDRLDFYTTPEWATEALMKREKFNGTIWECACGNGRMVKVLEKYNKVVASDIQQGNDFFFMSKTVENIVTNPPYNQASKFVEWAKVNATEKVAMILKLSFLEGMSRYRFFKDKEFPLRKTYVFCRRVQMYPEGIEKPKNSGTIAFAWYVWDKNYTGSPMLDWIND